MILLNVGLDGQLTSQVPNARAGTGLKLSSGKSKFCWNKENCEEFQFPTQTSDTASTTTLYLVG